ncbi:hypothetical protein QYE76_038483 [Lolium multiflorum]|uniref:ABC transporter C family member 13 n=1 Tax=Lolium multiflorum TaxID=4521 RepID=A0AAD8T870_LOLMU|nr:hypothetical protein QYE76_038483 [Lolium multiflorum]
MSTATSAAFSSPAIARPRRRSLPAATFRSSSPCPIPSRLLRPVFLYSPRAIPLQQQQRRRRGRRDRRLSPFPALLTGGGCEGEEAGRSETPFSAAGFFGTLAFSWLDPLITTTNAPLAAGDVPNLGAADRAETQYTAFSSALAATSIHDHHHPRPAAILRAIVSCHAAEIAVSALFSLLKVLALSAGPPLLKAFVHASSSSPPAARRERCCLLALLLAKCVESVSQRQWYFRSRRAGIQATSLLSAAIYRKQQRLPPSPTTNHSPGQILSYLTVDARRIGDLFPFRLHQAWATVLQLAVALAVLYDAVGPAAIASVAVILLTVAVNAPLARRQQGVHRELMRAQDMRLNAVSESVANMKALKIYAWENHFREVVRGLRASELRWLSAFQTGRAYTSVVFWASPALVSAATFTTCWFLGIPLDASNVFAFVAALRLVQDPINRMPDVIGAIIQGRASLSRIAEFLGAPELQDVRRGRERYGEHDVAAMLQDYVIGGLARKTVVLVTHKVEFLPAFDSIQLMCDGEIKLAGSYNELLSTSKEFRELVHAHKDGGNFSNAMSVANDERTNDKSIDKISGIHISRREDFFMKHSEEDQLMKREYEEIGYTSLRPYLQYLFQNKGYVYASLVAVTNLLFISGQVAQNSWLAANVQNPHVSTLRLATVYVAIGAGSIIFLLLRALAAVCLGLQTSESLFSNLLTTLFRAPISFFDSTPLGRLLSRVSSDLSIIDLDIPFSFAFSISATMNAYGNLGVLVFATWQVLLVSVPVLLLAAKLQRLYLTFAKEMMMINGTTKSLIASHLGESISGASVIRAFGQEDRFFTKMLEFVDNNASPCFHNFAATEWLTLRLEIMSATILSFSAFAIALLPQGTFTSGTIGMVLSYGLSLNMLLVFSVQSQCSLANQIVSIERFNQYMNAASEAPDIIEDNRPPDGWPGTGKIELVDLKIKYSQDSPFILHGITCTFRGGDKIGVVGRTGSGKTTLINALFRLVEPSGGKIIIDGQDITRIGLHDLRSRIGLIPQDPTLFHGSIRHNLDPLGQFSDEQIWEALGKCQLIQIVQDKKQGLDSLIVDSGSNWSMGQRQLLCLCRALLRRHRIVVLDEATASIDNLTDTIVQSTIRTEFADRTVITVAHRIPTVMDCDMVLAISDGEVVEYEEPGKLMQREGSLFRELVREYCSQSQHAN